MKDKPTHTFILLLIIIILIVSVTINETSQIVTVFNRQMFIRFKTAVFSSTTFIQWLQKTDNACLSSSMLVDLWFGQPVLEINEHSYVTQSRELLLAWSLLVGWSAQVLVLVSLWAPPWSSSADLKPFSLTSSLTCGIMTQEDSRRFPTMKTLVDDTEEVVELQASQHVWWRCEVVVVVSGGSQTVCFLSLCWLFFIFSLRLCGLSPGTLTSPLRSETLMLVFVWCCGGLCCVPGHCVLGKWSPSQGLQDSTQAVVDRRRWGTVELLSLVCTVDGCKFFTKCKYLVFLFPLYLQIFQFLFPHFSVLW